MHKTKTSPEAPGSTIHTAGTLMALWLFCVLFYFIHYTVLFVDGQTVGSVYGPFVPPTNKIFRYP